MSSTLQMIEQLTTGTAGDPQPAFLILCRHKMQSCASTLVVICCRQRGYLLARAGETEQDDFLKDPAMIQRLKELSEFSDAEKEQVFFNMDAIIREIKNRRLYSKAS